MYIKRVLLSITLILGSETLVLAASPVYSPPPPQRQTYQPPPPPVYIPQPPRQQPVYQQAPVAAPTTQNSCADAHGRAIPCQANQQQQRQVAPTQQRIIQQPVVNSAAQKGQAAAPARSQVPAAQVPTFSPSFQTGGQTTPTTMGSRTTVGTVQQATPGRLNFVPVSPASSSSTASGSRPIASVNNSTSTTQSMKPASMNANGTTGQKTGAYASLAKSPFPIAPYTQSYITKVATITSASAGTPGSSAGFKGWTPGLEKTTSPDGRGYCTDYAAATYNKVSGMSLPVVRADQFYVQAQKSNLPTLPPTSDAVRVVPPGSLVVWSGTGAGHVAVVTANDPTKKTITISESNWGPPRAGATEYEKTNEITKNFNVVTTRKLTYDAVAKMTGPTASGGTYTYNITGFVVPSSGFEASPTSSSQR